MIRTFLNRSLRLAVGVVSFVAVSFAAAASGKLNVLIVDGQNNHAWATTTPLLRQILEQTGRFTVDVSTTPAARPQPPPLPKNPTAEQKAEHGRKLKQFTADEAEY